MSERTVRPSRPARATTVAAIFGLVTAAFAGAAAASPAARIASRGGGNLSFGLEAETTNYCLPRAQLAISGIQVVAAIYDTLTVPNDKGQVVPYLAKSVTPSADFKTWTITLRPGIRFHDGTPVDAAAVKLNLDSYRGAPGAPNSGPLFSILFAFVRDVTATDPMTVVVTLETPVADFPAYLYTDGRLGIVAPAQLNAGADCATKMIGTGPFMLSDFKQNEHTVVVKNPNYWQKDYPKANQITFVPIPEGSARVNELQGGQLDITHTDNPLELDALKGLGPAVKLLIQKPGLRELHYYFLLTGNPPFNDPLARQAFATALDRKDIDRILGKGTFEVANSIMDRNAPGYLKDAGYPRYDLKRARQLVSRYKASHGGEFHISLGATTDPGVSAEMQLVKEDLAKAGISAEIDLSDQPTLINEALSGSINVLNWRNLHGGSTQHNDFDTYSWFANYNSNPVDLVNFGHYDDPTTQHLLDAGRGEADPAEVKRTYQDFNRAMAKGLYLLPVWYVQWAIGFQSSVSLTFPPLPDGNGRPLFVYGRVPLLGLS